MKTLGRILIILIAALAVIGATYALSQTTVFSALAGQPMGGGESEGRFGPPDGANGESGQSVAMTGRPEGRGGSWETPISSTDFTDDTDFKAKIRFNPCHL